MGSIKTLCLHSQSTKVCNFKLQDNGHSHRYCSISHKLPKTPLPQTKLQLTSKSAMSSITHTSNSNVLRITKSVAKFLGEKVVVCVVSAFILMGSFGLSPRPSLALSSGILETELRELEEEEKYEKLLEKEPRNVEALKVLVYGKMRRGKAKEAVKYVEKLMNIEPREVEWRLLEALCYETMGQFSKAKRLFKEILEKNPILLKALHGLAMAMHKNMEGPAVFEMLNKALEVARRENKVTEERNIKILIAQMHVVKGELEEGLKKLQVLVDENPRDFRPYLFQGIIYSLLDRKQEAAEQFEIYQSLVPEEFPQRMFLDDVVLSARTQSQKKLQKEFAAEFSYRKRNT